MEMPSLCSWGHQRVLAEREEDGPVDEERRRARDLNLNHSYSHGCSNADPGHDEAPYRKCSDLPVDCAHQHAGAAWRTTSVPSESSRRRPGGHRAVTHRPIAVPHTLGERRLSGVPKLGMTSIRSGDISRRTSVNDTCTLRRSQKRKDASFVLHLLHGIERAAALQRQRRSRTPSFTQASGTPRQHMQWDLWLHSVIDVVRSISRLSQIRARCARVLVPRVHQLRPQATVPPIA